MRQKRYAAIDIGTNTLLMLIADKNTNTDLNIIEDYHYIARLGEGVDKTNKISQEAIKRATEILEFYKSRINELNVDYIDMVGTSALRDAVNSQEVIDEFYKIIPKRLRVISGEEEARLSFIGTKENFKENNSLIIDIGGGSTELIYGEGNEIIFRKSINIGAVRLTERFINSNPANINEINSLRDFIKSEISNLNFPNGNYDIFAVAGTPTTLAQIFQRLDTFDFDKIHNYKMSKEDIEYSINILIRNSKSILIEKYKIHPNRADIILAGALILDEIMKLSQKDELYVSCKGLRYGVLINSIALNN